MTQLFKPESLDVHAFAQACMPDGSSLQGQWSYADLLSKAERLAREIYGPTAQNPSNIAESEVFVRWQAAGYLHEPVGTQPQVWLRLAVEAGLPFQCQRCLQPMIESLSFERDYRFVADERTAEQEDDESEEDLLVISKRFDLTELIEDELLMSLPLVPKHETCPVPVKLTAVDPGFEQALAEVKPNAFAALGALKKKN